MSHRAKKQLYSSLWAALVLIVLGIVGYSIEGSGAQLRPDGVGYGMPWSHERHARDSAYACQNCRVCHHTAKAGQVRMRSCGDTRGACHPTSPDLGQPQPPEQPGGKGPAPDRRSALHRSCVGCHKATSKGPQECAECHRPGHGTVACGRCHSETLDELVEGGHALLACGSCHTAVAEILENDRHPITLPRAETRRQCLSCHDDAEADAAGFPSKRFASCPASSQGGRPTTKQCLQCHEPHSPQKRPPPQTREHSSDRPQP